MTAATKITGTTTITSTPNLQHETASAPSRRKVFAMCSLGLLGAAGLAACSSDSDTGESGSTAPTEAAATEAAAPTEAAAASLVALSDVPVAGAVSLEVGGKPVIVSQPTAGKVVGFSARCPHQFVTVTVAGKELKCPAHGSTFDMETGKNLTGPAAGKPLPPFAVKVVDGEVVQA